MERAFQNLDFDVSRESLDRLQLYQDLLHKWQRAINLISPKTLNDSWERHFGDSAQLVPILRSEDFKALVDLGSGAGFPGFVLAMLIPGLDVHLIESDERKCEFLKTVSRETDVNIQIHNDRVENVLEGLSPAVITARAFASCRSIFQYCEPVLDKDPVFLLLKGQGVRAEVDEAAAYYSFDYDLKASQQGGQGYILTARHVKKG